VIPLINWDVRFKNRTWVAALAALIITFVYDLLAMFDIVPKVEKTSIINFVKLALEILAGMGIIQDPTTHGLGDSIRALSYTEPYKDEET
jgi:phi LC3 family holin